MHDPQHDAHVRLYRTERTVFYAETEPGKGISVRATWGVKPDKMAWAVMRMLEGILMERDGRWREDMERLAASLEARDRP